jgi:hypothetical protein
MTELSRLRNGKKALRHARVEGFVHHPKIECHRDRCGLVGTGIVKLAIHHDGNGNDARLARAGKLNQPKGAGARVGWLAPVLLDQNLRVERASPHPCPGKPGCGGNKEGEDDADEPLAI